MEFLTYSLLFSVIWVFYRGEGVRLRFAFWQTAAVRHALLQYGYLPIVKQQPGMICKQVVECTIDPAIPE
jgi:hypothetical protein